MPRTHLLAILLIVLALQQVKADPALAPDAAATLSLSPAGDIEGCEAASEDLEMHIRCSDTRALCGVADRPVCWTVRFACFWLENPLKPMHIHCYTQPGCCKVENLTSSEASAAHAWSASGCVATNYGLVVSVEILTEGCEGTCRNDGVWLGVNVLSVPGCAWCSGSGISVRVGPSCEGPVIAICIDDVCYAPCRTCPDAALAASSGMAVCPVAVGSPGPQPAGLCDPCDETANTLVVVGVVRCGYPCVNESVQVTVGLYDCGGCGFEGVTLFVGQHCMEWGVGLCAGYCCIRPVSTVGQPLYDPCYIDPRLLGP